MKRLAGRLFAILFLSLTFSGAASSQVAPTITSLSPTTGAVGASVTITGTNFGSVQATSTVTFNGTSAAVTSWSATTIVATVPSGATTGNVVVTLLGLLASNGVNFTVVPPPSITSLSPTVGAVGASVTITGTNFGSSQGSGTVYFNITVAGVTSWSATSIVVTVPSGATTGTVVVYASGVYSNSVNFTVVPPPSITSVSPTWGPVGASVTITGTNFGSSQGTGTVSFNGTAAAVTSWSATSIDATVPSGATTGNIVVFASGVYSNGVSFTVSPSINSLSPTSGLVGTTVTITGSNFGTTQGTSSVTFNGATAAPTSWSSTSIATIVPTQATTGPVVVTVGGFASSGVTFTVTTHITSLSPTSGSANTFVTVSGSGFGSSPGTSTVTFNGIAGQPSGWNATSILVPVPSNATTGPVVVTVNGSASNGVNFTVGSTGTIAGTVTRASDGTSVNGALVEVLQSSVVKASTTTAADGSYSISNLSAGLYDLSVSSSSFVTTTKPSVLVSAASTTTVNVVLGAPSITTLSPPSGPIGTAVAISGSNFGPAQGTSTLTFNGTLATPTSWSNNRIVAPVPSGATTGPVVVSVATVASNGVTFTVGTGTFTGTVTRASDSTPINGALIEALQSNAVAGSASSGSNGTYTLANLAPGTYDVRISASGLGTAIQTGKSVSAGGSTTVNAALSSPGTISGTVTKSGGAGIAGASVSALSSADTANSATTDSSGSYTISNLTAGTYSVQAVASGYSSQSQPGVTVTAGQTTTQNFVLAGQSVITYSYDVLGRLTGTVDSQGDAVAYSYDSVGNLVSISRNASSQVSISGFTPPSGPVGTSVTVNGTGFSATAAQDTVNFNGSPAVLTSAASTQLIATVPSGATTGSISVTAPAGSATSSSAFTVTSSNGVPTISLFSPTIGVTGAAVSITGTNFDVPANDKTEFNVRIASVSSSTSTNISTSVPSGATSGHVLVSTPTGRATSAAYFFVPPSPHAAADVGFTGSVAVGGNATVSISTAGQIGLLVFDANASQRVSVNFTNGTFPTQGCSWSASLISPGGNTLASITPCSPVAGFIEPQILAQTGTYTVVVAPNSTSTGSINVSVLSVSDFNAVITPGNSVTVSLNTPGQNGYLTFAGSAGQRVSVNFTNGTFPTQGCSWTATLIDPNGITLASETSCSPAVGFIDATNLTVNGTYTIKVDPLGAGTGSITVALYTVVDVTGSISIGGSPVTVNITTPGQNGLLTLSGTAGQQVSVAISNSNFGICNVTVDVLNPDGTILTAYGCFGSTGSFTSAAFPTSGTYTLKIDGQGPAVGSVTVALTSP